MLQVGIILLLSHAVDFISANSVEPIDCILAEEKCLKDPPCKASYQDYQNCSGTNLMDQVNSVKCKEAAEILSQNSVMQCKCQRMKREEHCLNIYWALHPDYVPGYMDSIDSPYVNEKVDKKGANEYAHAAAAFDKYSETNDCLKETNICSSNTRCTKYRNEYAMHCASMDPNDSCDQQKCHHHLREFFKKVPMEFTKRILFCQCNQESNCAERRRKNIVPECSFEEKVKKNCLELRDTCLRNNLCKSRFLDYQKHCQLLNKKKDRCPQENHSQCIQSYIRMIGTVMTPNFINNSTMETSLWCTCEGSGDQEDDCKNILTMFTSNKCLKSAIKMEINSNAIDMDSEPANPFTDKNNGLTVFPSINEQMEEGHGRQVLSVQAKPASNTAPGGSSLNTALTLSTTLFIVLKVMLSI